MLIVAGNITVEPDQRASYLADSVEIIERSRKAPGCLDVTIDADLLDPCRINMFELWQSQAALDAWRGGGPSDAATADIVSAAVAQYDVAEARPLFEKG